MMRKKSPRNSGRYSPRAALVAVGLKVNSLKLLEPVKQKVVILQKSIRHMLAQNGAATRIVLNKGAPQVSYLAEAFHSLLRPQQIAVGVEQI